MERKGPMINVKKLIFVLKLKCLLILLAFTASCKTGAIAWPQKHAEVADLKVDALYYLPAPEQLSLIHI